MDLNEVTVFIKVIQAGSFSKASKQLAMPKSTVSAKISSLEKRLGVTLIHRTTRKLHVTDPGKQYFERCLRALEEIKGAESEVATNQEEPQGVFRLTAPTTLGNSLLPSVISAFTTKFPKIRLELILSDQQMDLISDGIDLAIRTGDLKDSSLHAKKIGISYFAPYASPTYLKKMGMPSHPKDLREHQCLEFSMLGRNQWNFINKSKNKVSVSLSGKIIADDLEAIKKMAVLGAGVALLPTFFCENEKLVRILPDWCAERRQISFVYPAHKHVTPKLKAFMQLATELLQDKFEKE